MNNRPTESSSRAQLLATRERRRLQRMLTTMDAWWPAYAVKHPKAGKDDVVRRLVGLIDERRVRQFTDGQPGSSARPKHPLRIEPVRPLEVWVPTSPTYTPPDFNLGNGPIGRSSGIVNATDLNWYDVEAPTHPSTRVDHLVSALGAPGPGWRGAQAASFWAEFSRRDASPSDELNSPADRSVHMAVLKISTPKPEIDVWASFRTSLFVHLPNGVQIIDDWGYWDDTDRGSLTIDLCAAVQLADGGWPSPEEFTFTSTLNHHKATHTADWRQLEVAFDGPVRANATPSVYVGIRITFEGADCLIQTGFTRKGLDAYFGFRHPSVSSAPGLHYSYEPNLKLSVG
jgi:hypothetical protein